MGLGCSGQETAGHSALEQGRRSITASRDVGTFYEYFESGSAKRTLIDEKTDGILLTTKETAMTTKSSEDH